MNQITKQMLIARAAEREKKKTERKFFEIPQFGGLEMLRPSDDKLLEYIAGLLSYQDNKAIVIDIADMVIYDCCPMLQDPDLHTTLNVIEPVEVVGKILSVNQRNMLGQQLLEWLEVIPGGGDDEEDIVKN